MTRAGQSASCEPVLPKLFDSIPPHFGTCFDKISRVDKIQRANLLFAAKKIGPVPNCDGSIVNLNLDC